MVAEAEPGERPNRIWLRRRHVLEWTGITRAEFYALVDAGVLTPRTLGGKEPYYSRAEVEEKLVKPACPALATT